MDFKDLGPNEEEVVMMGKEEETVEETPAEETPEPEAKEPEPVKEEVKEEPKVEAEVKTEQPKMVPLAALHEAREEMKTFRAKLTALEEVKRQLDEFRAQQKQKVEVPKYEEDPLGNLDHRIRQEAERKAELEQKLQQFEQTQQIQVMAHHITSLENEFRKTTPDYDKAVNYVLEMKKAELQDFGLTDPNIINQEIAKIANNLSITALNQGKNPAELVYNIAKRYGYKNEVPKPVEPNKLEVVKKAQEVAGKTLSKGGESDVPPTAAALASEKFNIFDPNFDKKWKEIFPD